MTRPADLLGFVFDSKPHRLSGDLLRRMESSPRFTAFVETYREKIRKKIRVARDSESALDLRSELEVASCLLQDRRLAVAYEPYASAKRRGPDFGVAYRVNTVFNIEVARMRAGEGEPGGSDPPGPGPRRREERVVRILLAKLGQMQPGMANLLVIHTREELAKSIDLGETMRALKLRVEGKDPVFFAASGYASPAAFYKDFLHLSGILFWVPGALPWANRQARPLLDEKVLRLVSSLAGAGSAIEKL